MNIAKFILDSFIHIWPYLIITIPLAVFVKLSGASKYINKVIRKNNYLAIVLATAVGAISPFCSCGVIPIIASLLIGGVPLAPVMSFWIASPSMDPEIFFLSTVTLGWKLAAWRLISTFTISLGSGFIIHLMDQNGWLGEKILKDNLNMELKNPLRQSFVRLGKRLKGIFVSDKTQSSWPVELNLVNASTTAPHPECCIPVEVSNGASSQVLPDSGHPESCQNSCKATPASFRKRLFSETRKATIMVGKFMSLAFFINALIHFYVPDGLITNLLGGDGIYSVIIAALIGIPTYTSNITALPLIGGLLELGMNNGAALAFLIAGPMTTLPAMAAVWGLVKRRIFLLYLSFALVGAIFCGLLINLVG